MELRELQDLMDRMYGHRDRARGIAANVAWLTEEIGELAQALRKGNRDQQLQEFGDVLAWTATLANVAGVSLEEALSRYRTGCPRCSEIPCHCPLN
jgi:NTP pyrophosphatase (non-canonical NTP hydrolase)